MSLVQYNLCNRPSGPHIRVHTGLAPLPGMLPAPSPQGTDILSNSKLSDAQSIHLDASVWPGVFYSQATHTNVGADTGSHCDQEANPCARADTISSNKQEAYPSSIAPQSGTVGDSSLSASDKENIILSSISNPGTTENMAAAHKEPEDKHAGQWTEVHHHCKTHVCSCSPTCTPLHEPSATRGEGQPSVAINLSCKQCYTMKAAEKSLTDEQCSCIQKRMLNVHHDHVTSLSLHSEGPLTFAKGKTVDMCNWGTTGIDNEELNPNMQWQEFDKYLGCCTLCDDDSDADPDEQHAVLEYWLAMKKAWHLKQVKAMVETVSNLPDEDHDFLDHTLHESSVV